MKYECKHAYETKDVPYIVCDREPKVSAVSKKDMYHALCPYQRFCGEKRCAVLLPEWKQCKKNAAEKAQKAAAESLGADAAKDTPVKKSPPKRKK